MNPKSCVKGLLSIVMCLFLLICLERVVFANSCQCTGCPQSGSAGPSAGTVCCWCRDSGQCFTHECPYATDCCEIVNCALACQDGTETGCDPDDNYIVGDPAGCD